jgi:uncharacterized protein DUF6916
LFARHSAASGAAGPAASPPTGGVTRRRLLATGGAAGAAAVLGLQPWSSAEAAAPGAGAPDYLLRSTYLRLSTATFTASRVGAVSTLTLDAVQDLSDLSLTGSEDAFALEFSSSQQIEQGIHTFAHPDIGTFDFFVAPVGQQRAYEVVVNRSVGAPKRVPEPPPSGDGPSAPPKNPKPQPSRVRRVTGRRLARAVVCEVTLSSKPKVKSATVWLLRGERVVAANVLRRVHGQRFALRLPFRRRPRGGRYDVVIATTARDGSVEYKRSRLNLQ